MGGHPDPKYGRIERLLGSRPDVFTVHVRTDRPKIDLEASVESGRDRRREKVLRFATPESGPNQLPQGVMVDGGLVTGRLDLSPDESSTPRLSVRTKIENLGSGLCREYQGSSAWPLKVNVRPNVSFQGIVLVIPLVITIVRHLRPHGDHVRGPGVNAMSLRATIVSSQIGSPFL